ncbi:MAG: HypC/HybG/HupF family hydrogenase formation chaperone [Pseudomonadota bacterium]
MCLATPGLILDIQEQTAKVDFFGVVRAVRLDLLPDAKPGDYVLVHAGFAIQGLDPDEVQETVDLLKQIAAVIVNNSGDKI